MPASRASPRPSRAPRSPTPQRDRRRRHPGRPVQPARHGRQGALRRRALRGERPHPGPRRPRACWAAPRRAGKVIIGNCFPGFPVLENRSKGVREALATPPASRSIAERLRRQGRRRPTNYAAWEALLTANPDAVALIGLCAPDIASLGQLQAANPGHRLHRRRLRPDAREPGRAQGRAPPTSALARPRSCRATCRSRCSSTRSPAPRTWTSPPAASSTPAPRS